MHFSLPSGWNTKNGIARCEERNKKEVKRCRFTSFSTSEVERYRRDAERTSIDCWVPPDLRPLPTLPDRDGMLIIQISANIVSTAGCHSGTREVRHDRTLSHRHQDLGRAEM
jgi:hypothetical protein